MMIGVITAASTIIAKMRWNKDLRRTTNDVAEINCPDLLHLYLSVAYQVSGRSNQPPLPAYEKSRTVVSGEDSAHRPLFRWVLVRGRTPFLSGTHGLPVWAITPREV